MATSFRKHKALKFVLLGVGGIWLVERVLKRVIIKNNQPKGRKDSKYILL